MNELLIAQDHLVACLAGHRLVTCNGAIEKRADGAVMVELRAIHPRIIDPVHVWQHYRHELETRIGRTIVGIASGEQGAIWIGWKQ